MPEFLLQHAFLLQKQYVVNAGLLPRLYYGLPVPIKAYQKTVKQPSGPTACSPKPMLTSYWHSPGLGATVPGSLLAC